MEAIKLQRTLPELTPEHDDANSRLEYNERVRVSNSTKIYQRRHIIVAALTRTYNLLAESCKETAPLTHELMRQHCDMSRYDVPVAGGAFDGYRAWHIIEQNFHKERTDEDIEYYEAALRLQVDNPLADGCSPDEFVSKATTFVIDIAPFLGRPYSPVEQGKYIIRMLPKALGADRNRLLAELTDTDLAQTVKVMDLCRQLVAGDANQGEGEEDGEYEEDEEEYFECEEPEDGGEENCFGGEENDAEEDELDDANAEMYERLERDDAAMAEGVAEEDRDEFDAHYEFLKTLDDAVAADRAMAEGVAEEDRDEFDAHYGTLKTLDASIAADKLPRGYTETRPPSRTNWDAFYRAKKAFHPSSAFISGWPT